MSRLRRGKFSGNGTSIRLNESTYRNGSYGFNRFLTYGGGFSEDNLSNRITTASILSQVPVFFDCSYIDAAPENGTATMPVNMPPSVGAGAGGNQAFRLQRIPQSFGRRRVWRVR